MSLVIRDNSDNYTGNTLFGVGSGDGKCGIGPRTTHLISKKKIFELMVVILCCITVGNNHQ